MKDIEKQLKHEVIKHLIIGSELQKEFFKDFKNDVYISSQPTAVIKKDTGTYIRINKEEQLNSYLYKFLLAFDENKSYESIRNTIIKKDRLDIKDLYKDKYKELIEISKEVTKEEQSGSSNSGMEGNTGFSAGSLLKSTKFNEIKKDLKDTDPVLNYELNHSYTVPEDSILDIYLTNRPVLSKDDIILLNKYKNQLIKALRGKVNKSSSYTPSKRINIRKDIIDKDNIYSRYTKDKGKHIELNIMIDMSGSMSGEPVKNALKILYLFNELAKQDLVKGNIILTSSYDPYIEQLPIDRHQLLYMGNACGGSEGIKRTVVKLKEQLYNTNLVCLTDGHLTDEPVSTVFWDSLKIETTGLYISKNIKNLKQTRSKMKQYFHKGLAVPSLDELLNQLVKIGLKSKL